MPQNNDELFNDEELFDHVLTEEDFKHHQEELDKAGLDVGDVIQVSKEDLKKFEYEPEKDEDPITSEEVVEEGEEVNDGLPSWARAEGVKAKPNEVKEILKKEEPKQVVRKEESIPDWAQA